MKHKTIRSLVAFLLVGLLAPSVLAQDANTAEIIKQLQKRIDDLELKVKQLENAPPPPAHEPQTNQVVRELEQKVKALERNRELDIEAAEAKAKDAPKITAGSDGLGIASADGAFALRLKGVLQVDSRSFFGDNIKGNDSILLRRARPIVEGTLFRDFDFQFVPDFGGSSPQIFDAWLNYKYNPALQLQAGKFKSPIGLEQLQSDVDLTFNERALPTALVPNRDLGFELHGELFDGVASYAAGIFNGIGDARNSSNADFEDDKAFEGRLFFLPFKKSSKPWLQQFGFGVAGSYEGMQGTNTTALPNTTGGSLAGFATDGQQQFFAYNPTGNAVVVASGEHWRLSPQGYYYYGPFGLLGEYVISDQKVSRTVTAPFQSARLENTAWQITASWVLTGEDAGFKKVVPRRAFNPLQGDWGAFQIAARYAELHVDEDAFPLYSNPNTSADSAKAWSVGLNWFLNKNVVFKTSFSHTIFDGGGGPGSSAPAAVTRKDENVLFTRVQLSF